MDVATTAGTRRWQKGFTLVELMTILVVSLVVLGIGVPAYRSLASRNLQTAEINQFLGHLHFARSTSVTLGVDTILCPSSDGENCLDDIRWHEGFMLYLDTNTNRLRDAGEERVRYSLPLRRIEIDMHSTIGRKRIIYRPDGRSAGSNLTLTFCDPEDLVQPRAIILSNAGRPRISDTKSDGSPLTCT